MRGFSSLSLYGDPAAIPANPLLIPVPLTPLEPQIFQWSVDFPPDPQGHPLKVS